VLEFLENIQSGKEFEKLPHFISYPLLMIFAGNLFAIIVFSTSSFASIEEIY
jgi:hypothetical protein